MKTKNILSLGVILFLIGCNSDSNTKKEPIIEDNTTTEKSVHVEFGYKRVYIQKGEKKGIDMIVSPQKTKFGEIYGLSKEIDIDSCKIIDKSIIQIEDRNVSDVGDILVKAEWSKNPLTVLKYTDITKNYNALLIYGLDKRFADYSSGDSVVFSSQTFNISGSVLTPIKILSPKIPKKKSLNVNKDEPLKIVWSGGTSQNIIIFLTGEWTSWTNSEPETLACHVENDGEFTIPTDILKKFQWRQKTILMVKDREVTTTKNAKLTMKTTATMEIYQDKNATPPSPIKTMQEGYIGSLCDTKERCGGGECLNDETFADGYCSIKHCKTDSQCPSDAHCFIEKGQFSLPQFCAKPCSENSDCRTPYYHCREDDKHIKSCVPAVF